jgi:DNA-directed RNA polymerase subunit beta'
MVGMKGLIQNSAGVTIDLPIVSSFKEGLTPIEYFISTNGARKGMTDIALNTAKAGYLTRKLFVAAQSVMITEDDCGAKDGIVVSKITASGIESTLVKSVTGRVTAKDVVDASGSVLLKKNQLISKHDAAMLEKNGITQVSVRSPLTCKTKLGVCAQCYGIDLGTGKLINIGEAVGTIAAQAIGEPGTQLTMRTFHAGGVATTGGDIVSGLPRVEEVFEKRSPKNPAVISHVDGIISEYKDLGKEKLIKVIPDVPVKNKKGGSEIEHHFHHIRVPIVKAGQHVSKGDFLTDGTADIDELFKYAGKDKTQEYIINEVKKLYELQGENTSRKHIEIIVRQMFSRLEVTQSGTTEFSVGDIVEATEIEEANAKVKEAGGIEAKTAPIVMGITETSLTRRSVLSAASFQHTNRILVSASLSARPDPLYGIMENVIIGRLIPAGTGFKGSKKNIAIQKLKNDAIELEESANRIVTSE